MNDEQVLDLMSLIVAHDNRNLSEADVAVWREQAALGRWTWQEAKGAVTRHFQYSTDWLMPAHINVIIKGQREDRLSREAHKRIDNGAPADPERISQIIEGLSKQLNWRPKTTTALRVACPFCGAQPHYPCTRPARGGPVATGAHPSRIEALEQ